MSINLFANDSTLWNGRFNDISGNYGQNLLLDASSNFTFSRNNSTFSTLGSNVIAGSTVNGLSVNGGYYSNGVSALQIPADITSTRPIIDAKSGYLRYNLTLTSLECYDASNSAWMSNATFGSPTVTALSSSSTNLTINFNKLTQGYATANISNGASTTTTLNSFTFSNPIAGGQYTIMISLTGTGGFTPTLTITPPTVASSTIRFNFASISVTTSATTAPVQTNPKYIVLTIAYDGTNYYISGSGFNN